MKDCGSQSSSKASIKRNFDWKYKNAVVEWEGHVLRVDGDHKDDDEDAVL